MTSFSSKVKDLRNKSKLSQQELAKQVQIPQTTLSDLENGKYEPTLSVAKRMAVYFDVSLDWLCG